ncbi:aromatic ring-hydroxylating oxygenase subunit alpha [Dongia sedimenti]|uniref:Aromatic ring-hydroxylating dioxygenase subunit alpha n=1 Tax=Dongia sedimenti TaxID=3064282 RepID=A0ABU0YPP1_9PROT|nr:aromatic ring-hydroxylating dioxygenase subunit alpha [Rhodospirillaceae bacterium R-7]
MTEQSPIKSARKIAPLVLPAWTYRHAELNELEYEALFRPSWQFACHVNQVKNIGDFVTLDLLRDSILVLRGKDGELRAFMNVCRHRGAKLLDGAGTCKARVTCPYHGWSYNLRGELAGMPAEKTFPGADKKQLGLRSVELEILCGLVFVRVVPGGVSLKEMWKDYIHLIEPYRLEEMVPLEEPWVENWACNWKVGVDNNLENYHVPVGHPGYDRLLDSDLGGFMNEHGVAGSKSVLRDKLSSNWSERRYQQMAPALNEDLPEEIRTSWMFFTMPPNIGIDIYGDSMDVFQFLPLGAETCTVRYPIFVRPDARREMKVLRYLNARINRQVSAEDKLLSERVQVGLNSHGFEFGPLSEYEGCIHDFHDRVRKACPVATLPEAPTQGSLRQVNDRMLNPGSAASAA